MNESQWRNSMLSIGISIGLTPDQLVACSPEQAEELIKSGVSELVQASVAKGILRAGAIVQSSFMELVDYIDEQTPAEHSVYWSEVKDALDVILESIPSDDESYEGDYESGKIDAP